MRVAGMAWREGLPGVEDRNWAFLQSCKTYMYSDYKANGNHLLHVYIYIVYASTFTNLWINHVLHIGLVHTAQLVHSVHIHFGLLALAWHMNITKYMWDMLRTGGDDSLGPIKSPNARSAQIRRWSQRRFLTWLQADYGTGIDLHYHAYTSISDMYMRSVIVSFTILKPPPKNNNSSMLWNIFCLQFSITTESFKRGNWI